jgi:hypothetical protein
MFARAAAPVMLMLAVVTGLDTERVLRAEMVLPAPVAEVWNLWTMEKGEFLLAGGAHRAAR